jgi:hypothetical protein
MREKEINYYFNEKTLKRKRMSVCDSLPLNRLLPLCGNV